MKQSETGLKGVILYYTKTIPSTTFRYTPIYFCQESEQDKPIYRQTITGCNQAVLYLEAGFLLRFRVSDASISGPSD